MDRRPRWDGDEQMAGVADGSPMRRALAEMIAAMRSPGWVTEDPVVHLGPALTAWLDSDGGGRWGPVEMATDERWLVISAEWNRADGRMRDLRADAFALIGGFVEDVAHIVQVRRGDQVEFQVATGQPTGRHAAHGHLVRLLPTGVNVARAVAGLR
jgi:hypothetical protein